jgi:hypothetical protein
MGRHIPVCVSLTVVACRILLLVLIPVRLPAQGVSEQAGSLEGTVTNSQTGEPVSGAAVHLFPISRAHTGGVQPPPTTSQAGGGFRFDNVPPGSYLVSCEHAGFSPNVSGETAGTVTISAGQQANIAVRMVPLGSISGKITGENGEPVPGARVQAFTSYSYRGKLQLRRASGATANEAGDYTLKNLSPGKYYVSAEPTSGDLVRAFYPRALDLPSATAIEVSDGQDSPNNVIRLARAATYHVRGRIDPFSSLASGPGAMLSLAPRNTLEADALGRTAQPNPDGTFDIGKVIPGSYTLWLTGSYGSETGQDGARQRLLARQDIDVEASNVNGIVLAILPRITITGHVEMEGLENRNLSRLRINLAPAGEVLFGSFQSAAVNSDGSFSLQNLDPGEYVVHVLGGPPGTYVKSISFNRQDITKTGMDLSQGGAGQIDIVLRSGAAEVDGKLEADQTASNPVTTVVLVPDVLPPDGSGTLFGAVQPTGNFAIRNVPPGRYFAFAVSGWTTVWQNAEFVRDIEREGTSIEVQENAHLQIQIPLLPPDRIQEVASRLGLNF